MNEINAKSNRRSVLKSCILYQNHRNTSFSLSIVKDSTGGIFGRCVLWITSFHLSPPMTYTH